MTNEELKQYRIKLFRDATLGKTKPERVPHLSFYVTWKILDAGYKLSEAMNDYDKMEKVVRYHQEQYGFDAIFETGGRNAVRIPDALGGGSYIIDDKAECVSYKDRCLCQWNNEEDLDALIANPTKFYWEKGMSSKYACWADGSVTLEQLQKAYDENNAFIAYYFRILKILDAEYGIPANTAPNGYAYPAIDYMFNTVLGIKGLSMLMRRKPEKVDELRNVINAMIYDPGLAMLQRSNPGPDMNYCFDYDITQLVHTILNPKQFDRWLWPDLGRTLNTLEEKGKTVRLFMEGSSKPFWDHFQDFKKGIIAMHPETDDVFEMRKALPNCAIVGGMPVQLLGTGTKEQCIDRVKRCCDELGADGGFVLSQDKMVSFRNDATAENTKAVCDFIREYRP